MTQSALQSLLDQVDHLYSDSETEREIMKRKKNLVEQYLKSGVITSLIKEGKKVYPCPVKSCKTEMTTNSNI